jgi:hypothetical protein
MMNNNEEYYHTKDLTLATFVSYNEISLAAAYDRDSQSWTFENYDKCSQLSLDLRNKKTLVEPLKWEATRRTLLGMVHDKKTIGED